MPKEYRFYKTTSWNPDLDLSKSFVMVDNINLEKPISLPLSVVGDKIQLHLDEEVYSKNVSCLEFDGKSPEAPPGAMKVSPKMHIAMDDNYLYIWSIKSERWKRVPLNSWESK